MSERAGKVHRYPALIHAADPTACILSFKNLIEAHVLRSLRSKHEMALPQIRKAIKYAESGLGIERLLLSSELQASAGDLFLEKYGQLINLNKSGQLAMRATLELYLRRVEWDANELPHRLFPFTSSDDASHDRRIMIDPKIGFGRPILAAVGVATSAIAERIDAGETPEEVAADYGVTVADVTEAVVYEQAA